MPEISDELLHDVASNVARRIASGSNATASRDGRTVLLALSADGVVLERELSRLSTSSEPLVAVTDSAAGASPALASALARLPRLAGMSQADAADVERLISSASRVLAPAMSLTLASRVAALQSDTPASRVILRAAMRGIPVEATLNDSDFALSDQAPAGARRAVESIVVQLRELGIAVETPRPPAVARAAAAASSFAAHPSVDRFAGREPLSDFVDSLASQPCSIEPGQPCVDCGVCEMRGF
jgi:hypothetical protein